MPIKPELRHHYGKAWRATRATILERAGHRCECTGQCGGGGHDNAGGRCAAPNGQTIWRELGNEASWWLRAQAFGRPVKVVLTVAHLNHQAGDDRPENLLAMCQRCHLRLDRHQHASNAAKTRATKKAEQGGAA
jgi:hypothetical protein